ESRSVGGGEGAEVNVQVELPPEGETGYNGIIWIIVALVPVAIGGGILRPSINTLLTKRTSPTEVGAILGVSSAFVSAANAITPALGGFAFEQLGGSLTFFIGGIIIALLFLWALRTIREETAPIGDTVTESA
ncbi:MAG: MFS transporter, partial [Chloroflexi bacterium]